MAVKSDFLQKNTLLKKTTYGFLPHYVTIPLTQEKGVSCKALVEKGDTVKEGQEIAKPAFIGGVAIHSSVPGVVAGIGRCSLPSGKVSSAIKIKLEGSFSFLAHKEQLQDFNMYPMQTIKRRLCELGVVNTFSFASSLAVDIQNMENAKKTKPLFLVARLFSSDKSSITQDFIFENYTTQVLQGVAIIAKTFDCSGVVLAFDKKDCTKDILSPLKQALKTIPFLLCPCDTSLYPCGLKEDIIKTLNALSKDKNKNKAPQNAKDTTTKDITIKDITKDDLFIDAKTAFSAYNALALGQPVLDTFVYITGSPITASGIFKVKIGTSIANLVNQCGGFLTSPKKIIINGIMTGFCATSLEVPITKYVDSIQFLSSSQDFNHKTFDCTRCGNCRAVCGEGLLPDVLYKHWTKEFITGDVITSSAFLCSGCNLCNSVCTARLPLRQTIDLLKQDLLKQNKKENNTKLNATHSSFENSSF